MRLGAEPITGDSETPGEWIEGARGCEVLVDLAQPELPARIGRREIGEASRTRQRLTTGLLEALARLPRDGRPLIMTVSGTDDLVPDHEGRISGDSEVTPSPSAFAHIGVPVRRLVEASGLEAAFLYLGTVYGPGKSFAASVFPRLAKGRLALPGDARNRVPLVHVHDVARAIVHLASLGGARLRGRSWLVVDRTEGTTLGELVDEAARLMGVAPARRWPRWLMALLLGRVLYETMTRDVLASPDDLVATGFRHSYPSHRVGLPPTLEALGYQSRPAGRSSRWRTLLALAGVALVAVNAVPFPLSVPSLRALGGGLPILDMRLGYDLAAVRELLSALGEGGRASYLAMLWRIDLALPALFSASLASALGAGRLTRWRWVALTPAAVDYLENLAITLLIRAYPGVPPGLVRTASALTVLKLSLYLFAAGLAALGGWLSSRSRRRLTASAAPMEGQRA